VVRVSHLGQSDGRIDRTSDILIENLPAAVMGCPDRDLQSLTALAIHVSYPGGVSLMH